MISSLLIWTTAALLALWLALWCSSSAGAAVLAVIVLLAIVSAAVNRLGRLELSSSAKLARCCEKGESITGTIELKNISAHSHRRLTALLTAENLLTGEKIQQKISAPFFEAQPSEISVSLAARQCGCIRISLEKIRLYDVSGLTWKSFSSEKIAEVTVLPEMLPLDADVGAVFKSRIGEDISLQAGKDISEPFEMNEYKPGDDIRAINFKLSQKHDKLIVKRGSDVNETAVRLALFCGGCNDPEKLCYVAELAVSLSSTLCEMGVCHEVITDDILTVNSLEDVSAILPKLLSGIEPIFPNDEKPVVCICAQNVPENVPNLIPVFSAEDINAHISERGAQYV